MMATPGGKSHGPFGKIKIFLPNGPWLAPPVR
jgi:hypothetical protein